MNGREFEIVSFHVLELVASSGCSAYDCEFVTLAEDLGTSLVTIDKKVLNEFPQVAVSLDEFITS
jgi:predicted nucleic acid-binding protein